MKKTISLVLAAVLMGTVALSGCQKSPAADPSSSTPVESKTSSASGEKPVVTFHHGYFQPSSEWPVAEEMRKIYQEFADMHSDEFTFKIEQYDNGSQGVYDMAVQEIASGNFPDIVDVAGTSIVPAASKAGLALDLKPYLDADEAFKKGVGVCYDQNQVDGKIYSVREQVEAVGLWYNAELFEKAGAKTPEEWKTPDDFAEAVKKLKDCPDVATPVSLNQGWSSGLLLSMILADSEAGRELLKETPATFENNAFTGALDFLKSSALDQIGSDFLTGSEEEQYVQDFKDGKSALLFNGVWAAGSFGDAKAGIENLKPATFVADDGKRVGLLNGGDGFVINANLDDAKKEICVEFVKYMTSPEIAARIVKSGAGMAPSLSLDYDKLMEDSTLDAPAKKLVEACSALQKCDYTPKHLYGWAGEVTGPLDGMYAGLKDGSTDSAAIVTQLNQVLATLKESGN